MFPHSYYVEHSRSNHSTNISVLAAP
jgi:hypothetical protein